MGRRKKRVIRTIKRTLPTVFLCPSCGTAAVRVTQGENKVKISCGNCNLTNTYDKTSKEPIDIYNEFVDQYMKSDITE